MDSTPPSSYEDDADRDSELYLRGFITAEELVRRARERCAAGLLVTSQVPRF